MPKRQPTVFMFSGQGSQYYQMGQELYQTNAKFRAWMDHCDNLTSQYLGESLLNQIFSHSKTESFDNLKYSNPALFSIEYSLACYLMEEGIQPDILLGYSLGEITAATVSNAISLEDGFEFLAKITHLLEQHIEPGGMLAVLDSPDIIQNRRDLFEGCYLTCINFEGNFVVGGARDAIKRTHSLLSKEGLISQILPVRFGFHTQLIDPIESELRQFASALAARPPEVDVISANTMGYIKGFSEDHLWNVFRQQVSFADTIRNLLKNSPAILIDVGPSGTLATFIKYILSPDMTATHLECMNPFGKNNQTMNKLISTYTDHI